MSCPPPHQQQPLMVYRAKPDLRLAESYIPALVLSLKCMGYTLIVPTILLLPWKATVLAMAAFALLLYVDHLYLVPTTAFIDTTAVSLDVLGATLLVLGMSLLRPCAQQCQAILALWTFAGAAYFVLTPQHVVPRYVAHGGVLVFVLCFIYADIGMGAGASSASTLPALSLNATITMTTSPPFFYRTALYLSLSLVDIYLFRPLFQQENERLLFCKYGPVLLGAWPWCLLFWGVLCAAQLLKHFSAYEQQPPHNNNNNGGAETASFSIMMGSAPITMPSAPSKVPVDLDLMEAFRLAKQQHMGAKGAV